jgi:hypothetical protein
MKMRVLVATPTTFSREAWAFESQKNPRLAATAVANALTEATPVIFIDRGDLKKVMAHFFMKMRVSVATTNRFLFVVGLWPQMKRSR